MLLKCSAFLKSDGSAEKDVHDSVDFILGLMQPNGNIAPAMDEVGARRQRPESEELVHWCHGAPGTSVKKFGCLFVQHNAPGYAFLVTWRCRR